MAPVIIQTQPKADISAINLADYGVTDGQDVTSLLGSLASIQSGKINWLVPDGLTLYSDPITFDAGVQFRIDSYGSATIKVKDSAANPENLFTFSGDGSYYFGSGITFDGNLANNVQTPSASSVSLITIGTRSTAGGICEVYSKFKNTVGKGMYILGDQNSAKLDKIVADAQCDNSAIGLNVAKELTGRVFSSDPDAWDFTNTKPVADGSSATTRKVRLNNFQFLDEIDLTFFSKYGGARWFMAYVGGGYFRHHADRIGYTDDGYSIEYSAGIQQLGKFDALNNDSALVTEITGRGIAPHVDAVSRAESTPGNTHSVKFKGCSSDAGSLTLCDINNEGGKLAYENDAIDCKIPETIRVGPLSLVENSSCKTIELSDNTGSTPAIPINGAKCSRVTIADNILAGAGSANVIEDFSVLPSVREGDRVQVTTGGADASLVLRNGIFPPGSVLTCDDDSNFALYVENCPNLDTSAASDAIKTILRWTPTLSPRVTSAQQGASPGFTGPEINTLGALLYQGSAAAEVVASAGACWLHQTDADAVRAGVRFTFPNHFRDYRWNTGESDGVYRAKVIFRDGGTEKAAIAYRMNQANDDCFLFGLNQATGDVWRDQYAFGGYAPNETEAVSGGVVIGQEYELKVVISGNDHTFYLDDVEVLTAQSTATYATNTRYGLKVFDPVADVTDPLVGPDWTLFEFKSE